MKTGIWNFTNEEYDSIVVNVCYVMQKLKGINFFKLGRLM
jgi:hypothetical protein